MFKKLHISILINFNVKILIYFNFIVKNIINELNFLFFIIKLFHFVKY